MKRIEMVRHGAQQLTVAENAVETALVEVSTLLSQLGRMRLDSNLSPVLGQEVIATLVESVTMLSNARGKMVDAHEHLNGVKARIGCGAVAAGTLDKGEDKPVPHVAIVGGTRTAA